MNSSRETDKVTKEVDLTRGEALSEVVEVAKAEVASRLERNQEVKVAFSKENL
jgi:hypothetical protein